MRNFGEKFIFEKEIQVYNTIKLPTLANPDIKKAKDKPSIASLSSPASISRTVTSETLNFFPEGGSMIEGVSGIIAFKSEDSSGKGIGAKGTIVSTSGEMTTGFEANDLGMGMFMFNPLPGETYTATGRYSNGKSFPYPFLKLY